MVERMEFCKNCGWNGPKSEKHKCIQVTFSSKTSKPIKEICLKASVISVDGKTYRITKRFLKIHPIDGKNIVLESDEKSQDAVWTRCEVLRG